VISHDLELLADFQRVVVLHDGAVVADGPASDSIATYRALVT
jgi:biotin transport system ATP-binding protein